MPPKVLGKILGKAGKEAELTADELFNARLGKKIEAAESLPAVPTEAPKAASTLTEGAKPLSSQVELGVDGKPVAKASSDSPRGIGKEFSLKSGESEMPDLPEKSDLMDKAKKGAIAAGAAGVGYGTYNYLGGGDGGGGGKPPEEMKSTTTALMRPPRKGDKTDNSAALKQVASAPGLGREKFKAPATQVSAEQFQKEMDEADKMMPDQKEAFEKMAGDFAKDINLADALYQKSKDDLSSREMWEGITHGVALMASGLYGLKNGMDLSGVKFDKADWDKKREAARDELKTAIENAKARGAISKDQIDKEYARAKDRIDFKKNSIKEKYGIMNDNAAREMDAAKTDFQGKVTQRGQDLDLQEKIAAATKSAQAAGDKNLEDKLKEFNQMSGNIRASSEKVGGNELGPDAVQALGVNVDALERKAMEINKLAGGNVIPLDSLEFRSSDFQGNTRMNDVLNRVQLRRNKNQGTVPLRDTEGAQTPPLRDPGQPSQPQAQVPVNQRQPPKSPMPEGAGWAEYYNPKNGKSYWFNSKTGKIQE